MSGFLGGGAMRKLLMVAILACWPNGDDSLDACIERATRCARALLTRDEDRDADGMRAPDLHVGVGSGELWAARVGGLDGCWEFLL